MSNEINTRPAIVVQHVLALLKKGYTRYTKDDAGYGSIQAHYGLTGVEVKQLFLNKKLKARKTILPKASLNIIDEEEEPVDLGWEEASQEALVEIGTLVETDDSTETLGGAPANATVDVTEEVKKNLFD